MSAEKRRIRENFKHAVFTRDKFCCRKCGEDEKVLDAHHITDRNEIPNGGYVVENGISLCGKCHYHAENYHVSKGMAWTEGYHPNDLYALIGSSKEIALKKAKWV